MTTSLVAVRVGNWRAPEVVFAGLSEEFTNAFFLDNGLDEGWSYIGWGDPADVDEALQTPILSHIADDWPAGPFAGGWVFWLNYDAGAARAGAPAATGERGRALRVTRYLAFDHQHDEAWAVAPAADVEALGQRARSLFDGAPARRDPATPPPLTCVARVSPAQYILDIERCRSAIRDGDAYQLCLTTRFTVAGSHDPIDTFLRLRKNTPSHHAAIISIGDHTVVSASPEQFLGVSVATVTTKPIKGTRPRGATAEQDAALAAELLASEKERAENVMIVDLMRNDLSRIAKPGSVRVDKLWDVESYRAVHQLVSTVSADVRDGLRMGDVLDATFPAGSMTGAPKLSAMTLLREIEGESRGVYAGTFGWIGTDGSADLAMVIRTIVITPDEAYVGAGGGITWGSVAADEVAEVAIKARAPLAALGAVTPREWEQAR